MSIVTELDFEVIREPWNRYEFEDGVILKTKYVLTRVSKKVEKDGRTGYALTGQNIITISHVPINLLGPPSTQKYSQEELQASIMNEDVKYKTL
jgi:hypothetical protein